MILIHMYIVNCVTHDQSKEILIRKLFLSLLFLITSFTDICFLTGTTFKFVNPGILVHLWEKQITKY